MFELTPEQIARLWHRSYTAIDGLWFMKVEEQFGFDKALEIDNEVWKVFPRIQARMLKSMLELDIGLDSLLQCLNVKLELEGFEFEVEKAEDAFKIVLTRCPWHEAMLKSGRGALSGKVGSLICVTENSAWAGEFGDEISFELGNQICMGSESCVIEFRKKT